MWRTLPSTRSKVELPFLQAALGSFAVTPAAASAPPRRRTSRRCSISCGARPDTLIVVSSDLSHYLDHATAQRRDAATAAAIERDDWAALAPDDACGCAGDRRVTQGGRVSEGCRRGGSPCAIPATPPATRDRVVGYGAWAFA